MTISTLWNRSGADLTHWLCFVPTHVHGVQDFSSTTGQGDDAAAVILSLLTSRVEEENSTVGTLGGSEGESRDPLGGTGGQYTSRLLDTSLVRNTSSMGSQSSPLPLLRNGKAYSSDSRRQ